MANVTPEVFKETLDELLNPINERLDALEEKQSKKAEIKKEVARGGILVGKSFENGVEEPIFQAGFTEDYLSDRKGILKARLQKAVANGDKNQAELLKLQIDEMK
ncbi:hypothetical protein [Lactococcus lactis]|uniref:hypothetical protein n=1 Tax=Lactococcus lactis TaxID=1358 RepID=UPI0022B8F357|nr:hypothetical protein [Lactococcus lactis]MCZ8490544.1 hypothetical protein [Lactococcus lactis]